MCVPHMTHLAPNLHLDWCTIYIFLYFKATTACSEKTKGGCSDLCLPTRKNDYICACPTYGNKALSPDGKTCLCKKHSLLFIKYIYNVLAWFIACYITARDQMRSNLPTGAL